jgi:hypothetical protein
VRARSSPDPFGPFDDDVTAKTDRGHAPVSHTRFDELGQLGFRLSYQSLNRNIRSRDLRPMREVCRLAVDRPNAVIAHPPGEETQWGRHR